MHAIRWFYGAVGLGTVGLGLVFIVIPPRRDAIDVLAVGVLLVVMGAALLFWAWHGDWTPPDAERLASQMRRLAPYQTFLSVCELSLLAAALAGVMYPDLFGDWWQRYRWHFGIACAGMLIDLVVRAAIALKARRLQAARRGTAS